MSDIEKSYIVDNMLIKGLSVNRNENYCNYDYNLGTNLEDSGLRFYTHKYFLGH